MLFLL
ncbi:hypothetical protein BIW11_06038 [Tropilaelaps mercedesae]